MSITSKPSPPGAGKSVTYSRRPGLARDGRNNSTGSKDDEAKGGEAYDRIRRSTRGGSDDRRGNRNTTSAQRASSLIKPQRNVGALSRPSISFASASQKSHALRRAGDCSTNTQEKNDLEEAMARSLAYNTASSFVTALPAAKTDEEFDADLAEAKLLSMITGADPPKPLQNTRSYKNAGSGSTSTATVPHAPLHSVLEEMSLTVKVLDKNIREDNAVTASELVDCVEEWGTEVRKVVYSLEAAEERRVKDLIAELDFDRKVEDTHKNRVNDLNRKWAARMREKEQMWKWKMQQQKQAYAAQLSRQKGIEPSPSTQEQPPSQDLTQPRTAPSPPPHAEAVIARLTHEIATLNAEHQTTLVNVHASHAAELTVMKAKAQRLANANADLRQAQKTQDDKHKQEAESMKQRYEAQVQQLKEQAELLANANADLRRRKETATRVPSLSSIAPRSTSVNFHKPDDDKKSNDQTDGSVHVGLAQGYEEHINRQPTPPEPRSPDSSPGKRKLDDCVSSRFVGTLRSSKKAKPSPTE
ncbi:hypothetical protein BDW02DRAFT_359801 [Decorospora gaudefroyi]|uniref:Uncharacterized protein n=1 Tax=Decorospora gaudefroyi TaxID=184978 RepID=A0A6A5KH27_9PLEO|nr:hypothetical protein BDW02DRAFT_359801 [Decorospora gaudefroyi]